MIGIILTHPTFFLSQGLTGKDTFGVEWHVSTFDGWDGPEVRQDTKHIVRRHGAKLGEWMYGPRPMTIAGTFYAPTEELMWDSRLRLAKVSNAVDGTLVTVTVVEGATGSSYTTKAARAGRLMMKTRTTFVTDFEVPLLAPDPRKYDSIRQNISSLTGTVSVNSAGSIDSEPILTLTSPGTNPAVVNSSTGQTLRVLGTFAGSDTIVLDTNLRTVLLNGASRYDLLDPTSQWWTVQPGTNFLSISACVLAISWSDAFI